MSKQLTQEEFKEIYSKVPRLSADAIILSEHGVMLTLRSRKDWESQWHFPGVTVQYGETPEQAVHRAAMEETGSIVKIEKLLGIMQFPSEQEQRGYGWTVSLTYLCSLVESSVTCNEDAKGIGEFKVLPDNMIKEQKEFYIQHVQ